MKNKFDTNIISSNKLPRVVILFFIGILLFLIDLNFLSFIFLMLSIFFGYLYRNPERYIYRNNGELLSPIDGMVDAIDSVNGKIRIYVNVSLCGVKVLRIPNDGEFSVKFTRFGCSLNPNMPKAKKLNQMSTLEFKEFSMDLICGIFGENIDIYNENRTLSKGDRIGNFTDGLAIIYLNDGYVSNVKLGEQIKAGESVIAQELIGVIQNG